MRLDYVAEGLGQNTPLIRLSEFTVDEARRLHAAFLEMSKGATPHFPLHEQPWIKPDNGCRLWLVFDKTHDKGVDQTSEGEFICMYSEEGWLELAEKAAVYANGWQPFTHQWLTMEGEIQFLLSPEGRW